MNSATATFTLYSYGFTATDSSATLTFTMKGDNGGPADNYYLLDSVSVNHTNANTNVLINGGFDTGDMTGWTQYCDTTNNCGGASYAQVTTSPCYSGPYCCVDKCQNYDYLLQSFSTVIGDYYLISFYLRVGASGGPQTAYVMLT
jgi:hypothetical protein